MIICKHLKRIAAVVLTLMFALSPLTVFATPTEVDEPSGIIQIAGKNGYLLMLTTEGDVYQLGSAYGINYGVMVPGGVKYSPELVEGLPKVKKVTAGLAAFALTEDGDVYAWGLSGYTGLGKSDGADNMQELIEKPEKLEGVSNIKDIWAGISMTYAIDNDGQVYAWGYDRGRYLDSLLGNDGNHIYTPTQVTLVPDIVQIEPGYVTSYAVDAYGNVYSWGSNGSGALGVGQSSQELNFTVAPLKIESLSNIKMVSASMGEPLALTYDGDVYAWGRNYHDLLHVGMEADELATPMRVIGLADIAEVSSYNTLVARGNGGEAYGWGYAEFLNSGVSTDTGYFEDIQFAKYNGEELVTDATQILSTGTAMIFLSGHGTVYSWGATFADVETEADVTSEMVFASEGIVYTKYPMAIAYSFELTGASGNDGTATVIETGDEKQSEGLATPAIIVIIAASGVIAVGALVAFIILVLKKGKKDKKEATQQPTVAQVTQPTMAQISQPVVAQPVSAVVQTEQPEAVTTPQTVQPVATVQTTQPETQQITQPEPQPEATTIPVAEATEPEVTAPAAEVAEPEVVASAAEVTEPTESPVPEPLPVVKTTVEASVTVTERTIEPVEPENTAAEPVEVKIETVTEVAEVVETETETPVEMAFIETPSDLDQPAEPAAKPVETPKKPVEQEQPKPMKIEIKTVEDSQGQ